MRPAWHQLILKVILTVSILGGCCPLSWGESPTVNESLLKATFILQLVQFTDWPTNAEQWVVGVVGDTPLEADIQRMAREMETLLHKRFRIVHYTKLSPLPESPHLLFIGETVKVTADALRRWIGKQPILTISGQADFIQQCGMVRLFVESQRMQMEINPQQAERQQIKISSKLLRLARIHKEGENYPCR